MQPFKQNKRYVHYSIISTSSAFPLVRYTCTRSPTSQVSYQVKVVFTTSARVPLLI